MTTTIERLRGSGGAGGLTVRSRILATVLALTLLTLVVAGGTAWVLQRNRVDSRIDASLQRTVDEFTAFAKSAADPLTGQPYATAQDLIYAGMQREVPGPSEGMAGFVEGRLELELPTGLKINEDPELANHLEMMVTRPGRIASVTTSTSEYRYAIVKVTLTDVAQGALVVAFDRSAEMDEVDDTFRTYALVAAIALVVLAAVGWVLAGRLLSPLRHLRETAESITDTDLSRRIEVRGNDDLSELTRTVNAMLSRLEDAFTSQRELLDDAGHELRTPITVVRGHLELMDPNDPADAAATKELALSELDRMHRLADDLVLLAKSERPDFVQPARTSIGELTDNVLDQARALGERRWLIDARLEGEVLVDSQRITQALLQLAANAVKFSEPGSVIALGSTLRGGRLLLWVRDEGIGIAPDEQARIFERFGRASQSVGRDGAGLGLAIVAAIAAAHGGRVDVDSKVGAGSVFVLDLPARGAVVEQVTEEIEPVSG
ncbi:sensor histidine kinase [Georgenia yuyongxinii]|uniref:histidine kinase n=1 Tax=Georgenia yuyongxinii TaxID=2589797 RepID=A0A552WJA9_9MICO|nr:HAMP domain-containing sensor histidine kinase [Georgenia yuyongxinii]TRW42842.1 HAMP domain-containing histidine kinase [Georgenia yuyongxinii]